MSRKIVGSNKFRPKNSKPRRVLSISSIEMNAFEREQEFGMNYTNAHMNLNGNNFVFDRNVGKWIVLGI
jgi:hypothetical protein